MFDSTYRYTTLLFDADGTLFDYQKASWEALRRTLAQFALPFFAGAVCPVSRKKSGSLGIIRARQGHKGSARNSAFLHFFDAAGMAGASPVEANEAYIGYLGQGAYLLPGALELIDTLRAKYSLYLVTNGLGGGCNTAGWRAPSRPCF